MLLTLLSSDHQQEQKCQSEGEGERDGEKHPEILHFPQGAAEAVHACCWFGDFTEMFSLLTFVGSISLVQNLFSHMQLFILVTLLYHLAHLVGLIPARQSLPIRGFLLSKFLPSNVCPLAHLKSCCLLCLTFVYSLCTSHECPFSSRSFEESLK